MRERRFRVVSKAQFGDLRIGAGGLNAGEASIFVQVAHNKLRHGGYLALVLPLTFLSGAAWEGSRELIRQNYRDIVIVTIASSKSGSFAFSADTDVGECLLVARRSEQPAPGTLSPAAERLTIVSLTTKPSAPSEGTEIARLICEAIQTGKVAKLEAGPLGGTPSRWVVYISARYYQGP